MVKSADSTTPYINPNGAVSFAAIAGIERKLEVSFRAQDGTVLSTETSPVITSADRITVNGQPFYGFFLDLQAPAGDGHYSIRARVLTRDNVQVSLEQYPVIIDRTPPALSGGFGWNAWRPSNLMPMPDDVLVSRYESKRLWAEGIIETGSGLDTTSARFQSLYLEGPNTGRVALETPAVIDAVNKQVSIGNGVSNDIKSGVHFPNANGRYLARFVVFDRAGNVASFDKPLHWHTACPLMSDLQPFAVYDPDSSTNLLPGSPFAGFVPFVAGMEVKTNPVRLVYRIPRTSWWEDSTFGMSIGKRMPANTGWPLDPADWTNAQYAFERVDYPYAPGGTSLGPDYRLATPTMYSCGLLTAPDLRLSPAAPKSPKLLAHRTVWKNAGATNNHLRYSNVSDTILSAGAIAEARPYAQTYNMGDLGSCTIPPGETTCMVANNFVLGDTPDLMEMYHRWNRLLSEDGSLSSEVIAPVQAFDLRKPVMQSATLSADGHSAALVMSEYQTGIWWGTVKLASAYLEAEDASGTVRRINATGLESTDGVLMWKAN
ncbi:MAG: DUF4165 domain-containing protein, partial [Gammaproteobacteria bacterium]|nr:DUF4165 domain-containing protein [Gammaproteobacteria bacterium]